MKLSVFCNKQINEYKTIKVVCYEKPEINVNTCYNCGSVVNTKYVNEFIDFRLK